VATESGARGAIYDLGYQRYDGPRLGRRFAVWSLYVLSLRNAFGLGRGALPKTLAFGLILLAFIPAIVQLVLAAVVPVDEFEFVRPHEYYGFIQVIIILFVAALASDLVGNDRRTGTLALYFSRPIQRMDYPAAKLAALATALLAVTILPQAVMFAGNWLGASDAGQWARENADDFGPIVGSGLLVCVMFAAVGIAVAAYAERRAFALVAVLALFLVTFITVQVILSVSDADAVRYAVFASPAHVMRGFTLYAFDAVPLRTPESHSGSADDQIAFANLDGFWYVLVALGITAVAVAVTVRRYRRGV